MPINLSWLAHAYQRITAFRANPTILATLLVSVVCIFWGYHLEKDNLMAGGLIGAAVASLTSLVTTVLADPGLKDVPYSFRAAALADFADRKCYRTGCRVSIVLDAEKSLLTFTLHSNIRCFGAGAALPTPNVRPQDKSILHKEVIYHINGKTPSNQVWTLFHDSIEDLVVIYTIDSDFKEFSEDHAWNSPVDGYELEISAPPGFRVSAMTLSQKDLEEIGKDNRECHRTYLVRQSLFSYQGFRWRIARI